MLEIGWDWTYSQIYSEDLMWKSHDNHVMIPTEKTKGIQQLWQLRRLITKAMLYN